MKGIDVSQWQGDIDFARVKAAGIEFVILREGFGFNTDPTFYTNLLKCNAVGLPIKGVYHFSYALNVDEAIAEARYCVNNYNDGVIFFDFEYDTVTYAASQGVTLGNAEINAHAKAFCEEVKRLGGIPGIYYNLDYYLYKYDHDLLSRYVTWLADYSGNADYPCDIHQYSATGIVDGIKGDVDMNEWFDEVIIEVSEEIMDFTTLTDEQVDTLLARINQRLASLPVTDYARESSEKGIKSGVFSDGDKDGLIDNPQGFLRRQEFATVLNRIGTLDQILQIKK